VSQNSEFYSPFDLVLLLDDSAHKTPKELWWMNQEFPPIDIIPPWICVLVYHLGDEQKVQRWPQFRDTVSSNRHVNDHHHQHLGCKDIFCWDFRSAAGN
jgi:hypothetical protein